MLINASIEVRMTSSRLPGKVLMPIQGKPVLELLIERVNKAKYVDNVIVATTTNATDDPIIDLCEKLGIGYFRGSEPDVLERVYTTHEAFKSDIVVELTGDNPVIDPKLIDHCILSYLYSDTDYLSSSLEEFYPYGQAVQVFSYDLLKYLHFNALTEYDREHVTPHIYQNKDKYKMLSVIGKQEQFAPDIRHTLDTKEDLVRITKIFDTLYAKNPDFSMVEAIEVLKS